MKAGDHVRVVEDIWDDHREKSWLGWEGVVKATNHRPPDPYNVFVFFPKARGSYRHFDFTEKELQLI